jgi:hypothetical protein
MKINIKTNLATKTILSLCLLLGIVSCTKKTDGVGGDFGQPVILITGTEVSPIVKFAVQNAPAQYAVTATSTYKASTDINITFALDTAAVTKYNTANNTTYYAAPAAAISISNLANVINSGSSISSAVNVQVISTAPLLDGRSYLIPISIVTVTGGNMTVLESSRTIFLRIARIYSFNAISMNNNTTGVTGAPTNVGRFNACALLDTTHPTFLPNFTLELKNLIYAFRDPTVYNGNTTPQPIQTLGAWENFTESSSIGLRYAELGNPGNSLQLIGTLGSAFAYNFNVNQWYTISLAYDGNNLTMYVDGVPAAVVSGSMVLEFSRLNLGQSWGGYDTKQYVNGRIAECRVWSRCLTANEIKLNLCGADPNSNGLLAYWKFNEGTGHIFHNSSSQGTRYDMDWSHVYWDQAGTGVNGGVNLVDKSAFVKWTNDALNTCSQ